MTTVVSIVEGDGEVAALPVLLRRVGEWLTPERFFVIVPPIRVRRDRFLNKDEEFKRTLALAAAKCNEDGWILILLDADDDCPAQFGQTVLRRAQECITHRRVSVVFANREYEAWFVGAASSLDGKRGFAFLGKDSDRCDSIRGAKEWMSQHIPAGRYREITDQPAFSALVDLNLVHENSRSFKKLCAEWVKNMHSEGPVSKP